MKNRFYALMFVPLIFVACNDTSPAPTVNSVQTKIDNAVNNSVQAVTTTTTTTVSNSGNVKYVNDPIVLKEGLVHIKGFTGTIQPTLRSALQQDKTHEIAMGTCSTIAMQMTNDYNKVSPNAKVRRTSLKYRNPANKPDATDKEVLYRLEAVNDGRPVAVDMGNSYRVYRPLKIKQSCLACHGDRASLTPQVNKMLKDKYPHDLATGYKLGDFRGAVVAEIKK
jgi:hypothetical protein